MDSRDLTICSIYKKKELVKSISPHVFAQNSPKASVCIQNESQNLDNGM